MSVHRCDDCGRGDCPALLLGEMPASANTVSNRIEASGACALNRIARALEARLPADPEAKW
jgi:hypothetical protein